MPTAQRSSFPYRACGLIAAVWVGSQLTIGYAVAPLLFTTLDRTVAGGAAANLFRIEAVIGILCALLLTSGARVLEARGDSAWRGVAKLAGWMLVCVALLVLLQSYMEPMRATAALQGVSVEQTAGAARFGLLHGISTALYAIESVLGLVLLWRWPGRSA